MLSHEGVLTRLSNSHTQQRRGDMCGESDTRTISSIQSRDRIALSFAQLSVILVVTLLIGATISAKIYASSDSSQQSSIALKGFGMKERYQIDYTLSHDQHDDTMPRVAWLMSFPNSGTSFTLNLVSKTSQTRVATNYGKEDQNYGTSSPPVYHNGINGPFWIGPDLNPLPAPTEFVLTKTHCGGRCEDCGPFRYVETPHSFLVECLRGARYEVDENGNPLSIPVSYDSDIIHRAVHIVRNPFDNTVSRFNLEHNRLSAESDTELYPASRDGFRAYCEELNERWAPNMHRSRFVDQEVLALIKDVPCYEDFFRYVEWHNLAFIVTDDLLGLPTYILHYEDYETHFDETVANLLFFLELEQRGDPGKFISGKSYSDYYTREEIEAVKVGMKELASPSTWKSIERYFE